jgi:integral membrane protein (TIGR01906 family)
VKPLDIIEALAAGVLLVLLAVGLGVIIVGIPAFTEYVSVWTGGPESTGLDVETHVATAERVRAFVISGSGELPAEVGGREGFDERTVAHLDDVRVVVRAVRALTGVAAALLAGWAAWCLARGRTTAMSRGLRAGAILAGALALLGLLLALADFDVAFALFHRMFFAEGTWTFSADSLIIQLFPLGFWASAGVALAVWVTLCVVLMVWGSVAVGRSREVRGMTTR